MTDNTLLDIKISDQIKHLLEPFVNNLEELADFHSESDIQEALSLDSLDVYEFIMSVEDEFDIEITDEDAEGLKTFGQLVNFISDRH